MEMKYWAFASVLLFLPVAAWGQAPQQQQSAPAALASFLASNLSTVMADNDALRAQIADLQKQLTDAKAAKEPTKP